MSTDLLLQVRARLADTTFRAELNDRNELVIVDGDRTWSVLVGEYRDASEHAAVFIARISDERAASAERMLRLAARMGAGAIALIGNSYVVRFIVPAVQVETAPIERIVRYLHDLATSLEAELRSMTRDVSGLAHLGT